VGWDETSWNSKEAPSQEQDHTAAHDFEFGGPVGVIFMMLGLPVGVWGLFLACNESSDGCPSLQD
jgi:hypothetical protein